MLPAIAQLNGLDDAVAAGALAPLFEGAPRFVDRLVARRPHRSYEALLDDALEVALAMPEEEQIELIDSHPRIGAAPDSVSAQSYREQGYDRDPGTADLHERLRRLNDAYEARFGFRFVVHVAGRPRTAIAPLIAEHLEASRAEEKERALRDVIAIARDRAAVLDIHG
jgi:2-oxo-4-hydroxy-4-carboxy-5-ureidoimidazoline decarboxylase